MTTEKAYVGACKTTRCGFANIANIIYVVVITVQSINTDSTIFKGHLQLDLFLLHSR